MPWTVRTAQVFAERDGVNSVDRDGVGWSCEVAGKNHGGPAARDLKPPIWEKERGASAGTSQRRRRR